MKNKYKKYKNITKKGEKREKAVCLKLEILRQLILI